jgi:hypothetical protein
MRSSIAEPEHRFFLALLMNVSKQKDLLALVAERFPDEKPVETILRWVNELGEETEFGIAILDAHFPESFEIAADEQPELFMAALRHFITGNKKVPTSLRALSAAQLKELRSILTESSLRVLLGDKA